MKEKREFVRLDSCVKVKYNLLGKTEQIETLSRNIGGGGICISLTEELPLGSMMELEIVLPGTEETIFALGRLIWIKKLSSGYEAGIAMDAFDRQIALKYIARHIREWREI